MKIFTMLCNYRDGTDEEALRPFWSIMPDSTMIRNGRPVFLPDIEHESYFLCPTLCIRIDRLGKHIAPRFARRYYGAMAPAVLITGSRAYDKLKKGILPHPEEMIFDGACITGDFTEYREDSEITLSCGERSTVWRQRLLKIDPDITLQTVSRLNTIKSGDLILAGPSLAGIEAHIDTTATALLDGQPLLKFNVK